MVGEDKIVALTEPKGRSRRLFARRAALQNRLATLAAFFTGQGLIQALNMVTGFLLLRWMSIEAYAQYSVVFAFQSMLNILVDLGFSGSIVALAGTRGHDPHVVGGYIRCARFYRSRMFWALSLASAVAFPLVVARQPWPFATKVLLWSSVVTAVFFQGRMLYGAPLLIHRRLRAYYHATLAASLVRLLLAGGLHLVGALLGWLAAWFSGLSVAITGFMYRRSSADIVTEPNAPDMAVRREMCRYLAPLWPGLIFYAFQGQITLALIAIFGSTRNIAEVAALGRLAQVFGLLSAANGILIEPLIARTSRENLRRVFVQVFGTCLLTGLAAVGFAWLFPGAMLWLIGPKYASLGALIVPVVTSSSLAYVAGVLFVMNTARKWAFWTTTAANISMAVGVQIFWIASGRVATTQGIITLNLTMAATGLGANVGTTLYGLMKNAKGEFNAND